MQIGHFSTNVAVERETRNINNVILYRYTRNAYRAHFIWHMPSGQHIWRIAKKSKFLFDFFSHRKTGKNPFSQSFFLLVDPFLIVWICSTLTSCKPQKERRSEQRKYRGEWTWKKRRQILEYRKRKLVALKSTAPAHIMMIFCLSAFNRTHDEHMEEIGSECGKKEQKVFLFRFVFFFGISVDM